VIGVSPPTRPGRALSTSPSLAAPRAPEARWRAVAERDASADGRFVYSVETTGVYCRPGCPSRRPREEHVAFHDTPADAERAGFRACLRCEPAGPPPEAREASKIAALCRLLDAPDPPGLAELGRAVGLSGAHVQRVFKAATGVTPRDYAAERRAERLRASLGAATSVTEAAFAAGFGGLGRFYEATSRALGMTPTAFREGGARQRIRYAFGASSLGDVLVAVTARGVCAVFLGDDRESLASALARRFPRADLARADDALEGTVRELVGLVEEPTRATLLPLDVRGTAFQLRVWRALSAIPAGETRSYAELAAAAGAPRAVRAVAGACGANPVSVVIPCHRVVRADGELSGYRWGVERKRALLARERPTAPPRRGPIG
jgi:AraC family transcriptional regulator, regulatory protein of adaptative response / methylated-DNA-[protein]-cysteine methyltransferase